MSGVQVCKSEGSRSLKLSSVLGLPIFFLLGWTANAQISVVTQHNDIARTGANAGETILTPANVNSLQFGKLFSYSVDGYIYAQPLYVPGVTMGSGTPQAGTKHNVVFVATENDSVYAFDADSNTSAVNAVPLWHITLLDAAHGAASGARAMLSTDIHTTDIVPEIGITGTPVIDPATGTLYVVGKTKENNTYIQRLHALNVTTGVEKFGGPVVLSGSVPGNGNGSVSGTLSFDPYWQNQRTGLLLVNGIVYIGFGAHEDMGPWHGWILAYNAATLKQTGAWCTTPNQLRGGIWGAGSGLAADIPDPAGHPFGRLFATSGNGTFDAVAPNYANSMDYGDSVFKLDLTNGSPTMVANGKTVGDVFTPFDQASLDTSDKDQGSGGTLLLPNSASGTQQLLLQAGKTGRVYVLDQENLGGYHPTNTSDPQQKTATKPIFGMPAYWNGHVYFWGAADQLRAFSFSNGVISSTSVSASAETSNFPGSTPVISANGTTNGIVWNVLTSNFSTQGRATVQAHDATNVFKLLYSSDQDVSRDNPGPAVKFTVPTVANGKVYVPAEYQISVFGLLNGETQASAPAISPASESFSTSSLTVTMTDSTTGATIHYTTNGSTPTAASPTYTAAITVTATETIRAIALAAGHLASNISSEAYTRITQTSMPVFSPAPGAYSTAQQAAFSDSTSGATIYYTTNGTAPTTSSTKYVGPITVSATETIKAIATSSNLSNSAVASGVYTIGAGTQAVAPTFSPAPGTYSSYQYVSMASTTSGATIYYTTNGVTPTTSSPKYVGPIIVHFTNTIKAFAAATNLANSPVSTAAYTISGTQSTVATPTFSPVPGTYTGYQYVSMASATSGATIYYTTNGTTPTTSSPKYVGPIIVHFTSTIKAFATAPNMTNSAVGTAVYTIQ
ncbi:MAG TPA: chitobiase/beta-hexosaminidase C-terminal domain-containing protein [Candidatus Acidoferrum sp.]|nr:chitobiase/beta-hexosaminidase C-terminal domain-containing protein [Candidatus Acidoferrum sp.]